MKLNGHIRNDAFVKIYYYLRNVKKLIIPTEYGENDITSFRSFASRIGSDCSIIGFFLTGQLDVPEQVFDKLISEYDIDINKFIDETFDKPDNVFEFKGVEFCCGSGLSDNRRQVIKSYYDPNFHKETFKISAKGDSMEGKIEPGDWLFLQRLEGIEFLKKGKTYAVVTKNNERYIKDLVDIQYCSEGHPEFLIFKSMNVKYENKTVHCEYIIENGLFEVIDIQRKIS